MGSPFASLIVSDQIPLPFDEGQWVKVRKLTGRQHELAQVAHREAFGSGKSSQWARVFRKALHGDASDPEVQEAIADPLTGYDRYALVRLGLVAWSYNRSLTPVTTKVEGKPDLIEDAIDDLDDEAVDFIAREVLRLTKPILFVDTVEEAEEEKKSA